MNQTGQQNIAFGTHALGNNTTGTDNSAFGDDAMNSNTIGEKTALGQGALAGNTTGSQNVAVGLDTLASSSTAINGTGVGFRALNASNAYNNTAIGAFAGLTIGGWDAKHNCRRFLRCISGGKLQLRGCRVPHYLHSVKPDGDRQLSHQPSLGLRARSEPRDGADDEQQRLCSRFRKQRPKRRHQPILRRDRLRPYLQCRLHGSRCHADAHDRGHRTLSFGSGEDQFYGGGSRNVGFGLLSCGGCAVILRRERSSHASLHLKGWRRTQVSFRA